MFVEKGEQIDLISNVGDHPIQSHWEIGGSAFIVHRSSDYCAVVLEAESISFDRHYLQELLLNRDSDNNGNPGRGSVRDIVLPSGQSVIIRRCLRGGRMRRIMKDKYFLSPLYPILRARPLKELEILCYLSASGLAVPAPVVAYVEYSLFGLYYRGLLGTKKIDGAVNFLAAIFDGICSPEFVQDCSFQVGVQARKILEAGIFHPDLHLGNVMCGSDGRVFIIDFDRAARLSPQSNQSKANEKISERWKRSAVKHGVADKVISPFLEGFQKQVP